jgi:hypothetical protein
MALWWLSVLLIGGSALYLAFLLIQRLRSPRHTPIA